MRSCDSQLGLCCVASWAKSTTRRPGELQLNRERLGALLQRCLRQITKHASAQQVLGHILQVARRRRCRCLKATHDLERSTAGQRKRAVAWSANGTRASTRHGASNKSGTEKNTPNKNMAWSCPRCPCLMHQPGARACARLPGGKRQCQRGSPPTFPRSTIGFRPPLSQTLAYPEVHSNRHASELKMSPFFCNPSRRAASTTTRHSG